ncbi:hypothetical protein [Cupriavidus sp. D39]|uniref:hypothetical protein n=1 Tax=Cupriavidus sp. D39 TaxID=2997877 RepID=UPI00226E06E4|nr:hypothetical protein [Cupriavidus sp. D39]MCY0854315.1 hypothetical protein [Cupriavidus sp. D39]
MTESAERLERDDGADDESGALTIESIERTAAICSEFFGSRLRFLIARIRELESLPDTRAMGASALSDEVRDALQWAEKTIDILWVSHHANRADQALERIRAILAASQADKS